MAEPIKIRLTTDLDLDGTTPITLTRDALTVEGQRHYTGHIAGSAGIVGADILGLFAPEAPKVLGIAASGHNPLSIARIIDSGGLIREELSLNPRPQYVLLDGKDRLAILTRNGGRCLIDLVVNEASESNHMQWALARPAAANRIRLRIIRSAGAAFVPNLTGTPWIPNVIWDPATHILHATADVGSGPIPLAALCPYPRQFGCFLAVRYAGSNNDGKLHIVDATTRRAWMAQPNTVDVRWSAVQYVSHDDHVALEATPFAVGEKLVCDIEVVRVEPGDRLRGRYANSQ